MKLVVILFVGLLALPAYAQTPMTYEELTQIKVHNDMCPSIDKYVDFLERQLKLKGLENATPENLNDADRKYNAEVRIAIWALRIGCNNPNRYK